jgi:MoxR-like ATPase
MSGPDRLLEAWKAQEPLGIRDAVALTRPFLLDILEAALGRLLGDDQARTLAHTLRQRYLDPYISSGRLPDVEGMAIPDGYVRFKTFRQSGQIQAFDHFLLRRAPNDIWATVATVSLADAQPFGRYSVEAIHVGIHLAMGADPSPDLQPLLERMSLIRLQEALERVIPDVRALYVEDAPPTRNRAGEGRGPFKGITIDRERASSLSSGDDLLRICSEAARAAVESLRSLPPGQRPRQQRTERHDATQAASQDMVWPAAMDDWSANAPSLAEIARATFLPEEDVAEWVRLIRDRRQVVFYGPPGTGKTFVARQLALHLAGGADAIEVVQFHPSYAYEDFIEGIRPRQADAGSGVAFERADGLFKRFCKRARQLAPGRPAVMLIDEINRAPLSRVLGELLYLLEYRTESVTLPYSGETFNIPENVILIGTMNSADRSISLVDYALRRRFAFVPFFPDTPPVRDVIRRFAQAHPESLGLKGLSAKLDRINERIGERHLSIGHSYFLRSDLDSERLKTIFRYDILPLIEEHFFDQPDELAHIRRILLDEDLAVPADDPDPVEPSPDDGDGIDRSGTGQP